MSFLGSFGKIFSRGVAAVATGGLSEIVPGLRPIAEAVYTGIPLEKLSGGAFSLADKPKVPASIQVQYAAVQGRGGFENASSALPTSGISGYSTTTYGGPGAFSNPYPISGAGGNPVWHSSGTSVTSLAASVPYSQPSAGQWVQSGNSVRLS